MELTLFWIDGERLVGWNPPIHVVRHSLQALVQSGEVLVCLQWQFEICIMFNSLRRSERSRDQVFLKVGPPSRMGHSDVAGLQPLIERGQ